MSWGEGTIALVQETSDAKFSGCGKSRMPAAGPESWKQIGSIGRLCRSNAKLRDDSLLGIGKLLR
jgi:hypothetical protein